MTLPRAIGWVDQEELANPLGIVEPYFKEV